MTHVPQGVVVMRTASRAIRPHRVIGGIVGAAAAAAVLLLGLAIPTAASNEAPIVGTWTHRGGGVIEVTSSGAGTYVGTVTTPVNFGSCTHPAGERIWSLRDTQYSNEFEGTHVMCNGSAGAARILLDDVDNAATPTIRLDLYANGTSVGELTRPGRVTVTGPTPSPSATAKGVPTMAIRVPGSVIRLQSGGWVTVPVQARIAGNKDDWLNWQADIYDASGRVIKAETNQFRQESGTGRIELRFRPQQEQSGPFYACVWGMTDSGGVRTANAPKTSCAFLSIQQRPVMWNDARSCAPMYATDATAWMTGYQQYSGTPVPFWRACAIRDSGYRGMTVQDPRSGDWYDFREWSRSGVDSLFLKLMQQECRIALRKAPASALRACLGGASSTGANPGGSIGANSYYTATRAIGGPYFDVNLVAPGTQAATDPQAVPAGGQRVND